MSIGAELGEYILQTHNSKNYEDSMAFEPPAPSGYTSGIMSWLVGVFPSLSWICATRCIYLSQTALFVS